ncbi:hypothetical protein AWH60_01115 [Pseudoalteromonas haloplanktis]|nr:hypothetical protein AWH60_01115 [Pseudoalteromonas haloplanktis]
MTSHRDLNSAHESAVLDSYKNLLSSQGKVLEVIDRPDPPDAIVKIDGIDTWIEITDAHFSQETAISITSYAADDKAHIPSKAGLIVEPDLVTNERVESAIRAKLQKRTMQNIAATSKPGILLVGLYGPFFDIFEVESNFSDEFKRELKTQNIFSSIYVYQTCSENSHAYHKIR